MSLRSILTEPSQPVHPVHRYGVLIFILCLIALEIRWHLRLPPGFDGDRYMADLIILMLLVSHLAYSFKWSMRVTVVLRILVLILIASTFVYALYALG